MYSEEAMKKHGAFSWNELMTTDVEGAKAFYGELLGWQLAACPDAEMEYVMAKSGDTQLAGVMAIPKEAKGMPASWGGYITVDDVESTAKKAEQLGGKVCMGPQDIPSVGRFVVVQDPQGAVITFITYNAECLNNAG